MIPDPNDHHKLGLTEILELAANAPDSDDQDIEYAFGRIEQLADRILMDMERVKL